MKQENELTNKKKCSLYCTEVKQKYRIKNVYGVVENCSMIST